MYKGPWGPQDFLITAGLSTIAGIVLFIIGSVRAFQRKESARFFIYATALQCWWIAILCIHLSPIEINKIGIRIDPIAEWQ